MKACRILFGLFLAGTATALTATEPEIVVQGQRYTEEQLQSEARDFVTTLAVPSFNNQYSRWNAPVCPVVQGLGEAHARMVTDKVRAIAAEAGARVGKPGCDGNIVIVFTDDARGVYRKVAARNGGMFSTNNVGPAEHKALSQSDMPVRWWYGLSAMDLSGMRASPDRMGGAASSGDYNSGTLNNYNGGSHIRTGIRMDQFAAAVLVDVKLAEGARLDALAAYVAMVTLTAQRMPSPPVSVRSIANLFVAGRDRETDLTDWDRAYLKALYKTPANLALTAHRAQAEPVEGA